MQLFVRSIHFLLLFLTSLIAIQCKVSKYSNSSEEITAFCKTEYYYGYDLISHSPFFEAKSYSYPVHLRGGRESRFSIDSIYFEHRDTVYQNKKHLFSYKKNGQCSYRGRFWDFNDRELVMFSLDQGNVSSQTRTFDWLLNKPTHNLKITNTTQHIFDEILSIQSTGTYTQKSVARYDLMKNMMYQKGDGEALNIILGMEPQNGYRLISMVKTKIPYDVEKSIHGLEREFEFGKQTYHTTIDKLEQSYFFPPMDQWEDLAEYLEGLLINDGCSLYRVKNLDILDK